MYVQVCMHGGRGLLLLSPLVILNHQIRSTRFKVFFRHQIMVELKKGKKVERER